MRAVHSHSPDSAGGHDSPQQLQLNCTDAAGPPGPCPPGALSHPSCHEPSQSTFCAGASRSSSKAKDGQLFKAAFFPLPLLSFLSLLPLL